MTGQSESVAAEGQTEAIEFGRTWTYIANDSGTREMKQGLSLAFLAACLYLPLTVTALETKDREAMEVDNQSSPDSLLEEADAVFQSHEYSQAIPKYELAAERAESEFNNSVRAEALAQIARLHLILGKADEGRSILEQVASLTTESDPMGWSRYLSVKGRYEWKADDLKAAVETFDRMYSYCNLNTLWGRAVDAANMLAIVSEDTEDQLKWARRGIEAAEAGDVERWLGPLWNNLASIHYDLDEFEPALDGYLKAREYHWRHGGEVQKLFADYHVGMTFRRLGRLDDSEKWLRPVLAWAERIENHAAIGQALEDLGEVAIARGEKKQGLDLLKRALDEYKLAGYDKDMPEIFTGLKERVRQLGG